MRVILPVREFREVPAATLPRTLFQHAERLPGAADPDAVATLALGRSHASVVAANRETAPKRKGAA